MSLTALTGLVWIPSVSYLDCDVPTSFTLAIPMGYWRYRSQAQGGRDMAASRVTESFAIRHDRILGLRLRFTEEEWVESVEPWLKVVHGQEQSFTVQLDKDVPATAHTVYLVSPVTGDEVAPEPNPFDGVLELDVAVMTADGSAFSYPYFPSLK